MAFADDAPASPAVPLKAPAASVEPEPAAPAELPVAAHARAGWKASRAITARLAIDNIADARALDHGSGFFLPGFSATSSLEVRLGQ